MNVIFDICGVMLEWKPDQIIGKYFQDARVKKIVREEILFHPDWRELDRGTLAKEEIIRRSSERTGLPVGEVDRMVSSIPGSLLPIPETIKIIESLKRKGHRLFALSNIPFMSIEYVEKEYSFFDWFEGMVVSCRVGMIKPEPGIFRYALDKYNLRKADTLFIDDSETNVRAAAELGIRSVLFTGPQQCESELQIAGFL